MSHAVRGTKRRGGMLAHRVCEGRCEKGRSRARGGPTVNIERCGSCVAPVEPSSTGETGGAELLAQRFVLCQAHELSRKLIDIERIGPGRRVATDFIDGAAG